MTTNGSSSEIEQGQKMALDHSSCDIELNSMPSTFFIDKISDIKKSIQAAIDQDRPTNILCDASGDSDIAKKLDSLVEGISMVYKGQISKSDLVYTRYLLVPGNDYE